MHCVSGIICACGSRIRSHNDTQARSFCEKYRALRAAQYNIFSLYLDIPQSGAEPHPQTVRSCRWVSVCIFDINGTCFKNLLTSEHTLGVRDIII